MEGSMLSRLEIRDFALIDFTVFDLKEGLTILTGETGAGKSIVIDSIGAITGNRMNKDVIRHGCDCAVITAVFEGENLFPNPRIFEELGIPFDSSASIITREIYQNGKTYARLNGTMIPLSALKEITKNLLDIHGQHENQSIFRQEMQSDLLDRFGGEPVLYAIAQYQKDLVPYNECLHSLQEFIVDEAQKEQLIDILEFQIKEIKTIHPKIKEDEELSERRKIISNVEKIKTALEESYYYLNGDTSMPALAAVTSAKNLMEHQLKGFEEFESLPGTLAEIEYQLEEVCERIRIEIEKINVEPGELERIDVRLDQLFRLKKKYGGSIESVLDFYRNASRKLEFIRSSEERTRTLLKEKEIFYIQLQVDAKRISENRNLAAKVLEKKICEELNELGMKGTRFSVQITHQENPAQLSKNGFDLIEFLISPNVGEELKPLSRIASGGEASRIMLAIKTILAESDQIPLLIFDEVDTGISGKTAGLLGEKLLSISKTHQVLCVTHMAQIAARADQNIYIEKIVVDNETITKVKYLKDEERVIEIARLLSGGEYEKKALDLAQEMIQSRNREF